MQWLGLRVWGKRMRIICMQKLHVYARQCQFLHINSMQKKKMLAIYTHFHETGLLF